MFLNGGSRMLLSWLFSFGSLWVFPNPLPRNFYQESSLKNSASPCVDTVWAWFLLPRAHGDYNHQNSDGVSTEKLFLVVRSIFEDFTIFTLISVFFVHFHRVAVQVLCSYITLPLYALVTQVKYSNIWILKNYVWSKKIWLILCKVLATDGFRIQRRNTEGTNSTSFEAMAFWGEGQEKEPRTWTHPASSYCYGNSQGGQQ